MKHTITLGPDKWPVDQNGRRLTYWEFRRELVYYDALANFVRIIGADAESLIDIGSAGCNYITWFDWIPDRVSLDLSYPTKAPGIRPIKANFFDWKPDKAYDVVLCCQVLEHIEDVHAFARKLRSLGKRILVSVPHMWKAGSIPGHVNDPVSLADVEAWFGQKPHYSMVVTEPFGEERLFCFWNYGPKIDTTNTSLMNALATHPINPI
ncbi:MAG: class I SAM-dependent methyltransferase [Rhizobiaceae bacterium]|nr:MAG: class I SAM-dependent methyltransferase [Rhizobiaceae bacterium]CAG0972318.1 hypothetical protein RHIZO_01285 [Rhizobiaceae bacterium]